MSHHSWTRRFLNRAVRIDLESDRDSTVLGSLLEPLPGGNRQALDYTVRDGPHSRFLFTTPAGECSTVDGLPEAFHALETDLYETRLCAEKTIFIVHASAVFHPESNRTVVLPGPSHCGKSTLAAALTASGRFQYLAEEAVGLDHHDGTVFSYTKPLKLRYGAEKLFLRDSGWHCHPVRTLGFTYAVPPPHRIAPLEKRDGPVLFVFPAFVLDAESSLERVSPAMAVGQLATCSINSPLFLAANLKHLAARNPERASWKLTWSSPDQAVGEIARLCLQNLDQ